MPQPQRRPDPRTPADIAVGAAPNSERREPDGASVIPIAQPESIIGPPSVPLESHHADAIGRLVMEGRRLHAERVANQETISRLSKRNGEIHDRLQRIDTEIRTHAWNGELPS